jgi:hypothetical protein
VELNLIAQIAREMGASRNRLQLRGANGLPKSFRAQGSFHQFLTSVPKSVTLP